MAPSRPRPKGSSAKAAKIRQAAAANKARSIDEINAEQHLAQASAKLQEGSPAEAKKSATAALKEIGDEGTRAGYVLALLGEIHIELGNIDKARGYFLRAVARDPEGELAVEVGGGPEKFLWLAQLSETGGKDSVEWFRRGAEALRRQIQGLTSGADAVGSLECQAECALRTAKLAETLCAVAEVYMTDLSWEEDAEQQCETLVTEATMVAPASATAWQTLANVRISQERTEEAKQALSRSLDTWTDLDPESPLVPDYATRVGLVRLLIEVEMLDEALQVAERLVGEDDQSVEAWYLGGYCLFLLGQAGRGKDTGADSEVSAWKPSWSASRQWLKQCRTLFSLLAYEDRRLGEHAEELLETLHKDLGDESTETDEDEWEDGDGSDADVDEEMTNE